MNSSPLQVMKQCLWSRSQLILMSTVICSSQQGITSGHIVWQCFMPPCFRYYREMITMSYVTVFIIFIGRCYHHDKVSISHAQLGETLHWTSPFVNNSDIHAKLYSVRHVIMFTVWKENVYHQHWLSKGRNSGCSMLLLSLSLVIWDGVGRLWWTIFAMNTV